MQRLPRNPDERPRHGQQTRQDSGDLSQCLLAHQLQPFATQLVPECVVGAGEVVTQAEEANFGRRFVLDQRAVVVEQPALVRGIPYPPAMELHCGLQRNPQRRQRPQQQDDRQPPRKGQQHAGHRDQGDRVL